MKFTVTKPQSFIGPLGRRTRQLPETIYYLSRRLVTEKVSKKIFFLHHPKCGGTSIDHAIQNSFGVSEFLLKRNSYHLDPRASLPGWSSRDYREKILLDSMSNGKNKYISGHFPYSQKAFREFGQEWNFITVLRNPVSRWFSLYFFGKYKGSDHAKINMEIESYLESEQAITTGCSYVRVFTDKENFASISSLDQATLNKATDQAIKNLNDFALVGVLEELDMFVRDFEKVFSTELFIPNFNRNPASKSNRKSQVTDEVHQRVIELCQPNIKVYESVLRRIHEHKGWS